jgi:hypothetical protein
MGAGATLKSDEWEGISTLKIQRAKSKETANFKHRGGGGKSESSPCGKRSRTATTPKARRAGLFVATAFHVSKAPSGAT